MSDETDLNSESNAKNSDSKSLVSKAKKTEKHKTTKEKLESPSADNLFSAKPMPKMQSKKRKNTWLIPSIITLLVIAAILTSGWTFYQQAVFNQNWAEQQTKIDEQMSQQRQVIDQAKKLGDSSMQVANRTQQQLNQLSAKNKQLQESLMSTQERIKVLSGRQKQDWMLAEVAYLIKAAQLQLGLQKDKATAIQLLKTADRRIIEIADNGLLPIREAIARDLSDLSLIQNPDITGITLALNAINQQIPRLELLALQFDPLEKSINNTSNTEDQEGFTLEKIYQSFLNDFVVIKDHSEPVKPLMTTDQRINLNNNIQLAIQQAQIALTQGNEVLYRLNIENAIQWTDEFFKHDEKAKRVTEQLNVLKTKPIEVHYPNKLNAQQALSEISQQQLYRWLESSLSSPIPNIAADIIETDKLPETKPQQEIINSQIDLEADPIEEGNKQ